MPFKLKNLTDTLKNLKREKSRQKLCPVCKNPDLKLSSSLDLGITPTKYVCQKCGYTGPLIMEIEEDRQQTK